MSKSIRFVKDGKIYEAEQVPLKATLINVTDRKATNIIVDSVKDLGDGKYEILLFGGHPGWDRNFVVKEIDV